MMSRSGLLILNLGTPASPHFSDVRRYLACFLSDKRVITLPVFLRYLLLYMVILPFRTRKTTRAYKKIWTSQGSPLFVNSHALESALQAHVQDRYQVCLAMRYGEPSIARALHQLRHCERLTILPLYPQYASASTGSCIEKTLQLIGQQTHIPTLHVITTFYQHPAFIRAQAALIQPHLTAPDTFVLFSYHGLPEAQLATSGCEPPCKKACPRTAPETCYRAQCYTTSRHLAKALNLAPHLHTTAFQSRLGVAPWTQPYTIDTLKVLAQKKIKRLVVACPAFTADCLETLEEIGDMARKQWLALGGTHFELVQSLNAHPLWVQAIDEIISSSAL